MEKKDALLIGPGIAIFKFVIPFLPKGKTWEKVMIKSLFAIAILSGSISAFAGDVDHYNDEVSTINQYNDESVSYPQHYNTGSADVYEEDTATSSMSSTTTTEADFDSGDEYSDEASSAMSATSSAGAMNADTTVTGEMGTLESLGEKYNKLHVGLLGGVNAPSDDDVDASSEYGLDIGYQPTDRWGVGVEATTTELDRADEARRTMALLKATTRFGGDIPFVKDIFVGAGAGPVITDGTWRVGGGPIAGFDIPLTKNRSRDFLSLGANAKYIWTNESPDSLISALALKYWF